MGCSCHNNLVWIRSCGHRALKGSRLDSSHGSGRIESVDNLVFIFYIVPQEKELENIIVI